MQYHADLLTPAYWQACKQRIMEGRVDDVFPYPQEVHFCYRPLIDQVIVDPLN